MPDRPQLVVSVLALMALLLATAPAAGAGEDLEPIGSVPIDEPFEKRDSGPAVSLEDDREAAGTVAVPDEATAVEFEMEWPSEDGKEAKVDLCFCTGTDCPHKEAFRTFEDIRNSLTFRAQAPEDGGSLAWEAAEPRNVPEDAHVRGQAVFYAPANPAPPAKSGAPTADTSEGSIGWWAQAGAFAFLLAGAGVAIGAGASTRWLPPGLVGLYHRISDDELLDHPVREAIYERVEEEPGVHFRQLMRDLDKARGNLQRHLDRMVEGDLLREAVTDGYRCYFVTGTVTPEVQQAAPLLRARGARELLQAVLNEPGDSLTGLSERLGLNPSTVSYHLDRLQAAGLAERRDAGNRLEIHATEQGRLAANQLEVH